jgi:hypothetical protein
MGGNSCASNSNWSGIDDIAVPVHPNSYYVDIYWWDSYWGYEEITEYPNVEAKIPGEIIILRY